MNIAVANIIPSITNPRTTIDGPAMQELAESIRKHGVLQPVLVRPVPEGRRRLIEAADRSSTRWGVGIGEVPGSVVFRTGLKKRDAEDLLKQMETVTHELVCGYRRWQASQMAGVTAIPCNVRELTDKEVMEIQVVENLQRSDLTPLEEAEAYSNLVHNHGYTVDDLAAKLGKSRGYVYARMKLASLCAEAKKALNDGTINHSIALLIARLHSQEDQDKATAEILADKLNGPMSFREAKRYIEGEFMLDLASAKWPLDQFDIAPGVGPCSTCLKRSGAEPELFSDVGSADVCTDSACFQRKREGWAKIKVTEARQKGHQVIQGREADQALWSGKFVKLDEKCFDAKTVKPYRKLLGADVKPTIMVADDGNVVECMLRKDAHAILEEKGIIAKSQSEAPDTKAEVAKAKLEAQINRKILAAVTPQILEAMCCPCGNGISVAEEMVEPLVREVFSQASIDQHDAVAKRRGISTKCNESRQLLNEWLENPERTPVEMLQVAFELIALSRPTGYAGEWNESFEQCAKVAGLDLDEIKTEIRKELSEEKGGKK